MKKISTLFRKDPADLSRVICEVAPENEWAMTEGRATRKFDGAACAVIEGKLYKRYDVKSGRTVPPGAIACQEPDPISGHWPHWVLVDAEKPEDKYFIEGWNRLLGVGDVKPQDGTYELIGPAINGGKERINFHLLFRHGIWEIDLPQRDFLSIREYLEECDFEGIVFHHPDGRMCKIRKSDFGFKREAKQLCKP